MTAKMGKYNINQIFHAISHDNNPTIIHFMFPPNNKVEATQVLNGLPFMIAEKILFNHKKFITR